MPKVRFFISGVTRTAVEFLTDEINEWIEYTGITIKEIHQTFGQAPTGMSGTAENVLFLSVWFDPKKSDRPVSRRSTDKSLQVAAALTAEGPKIYFRHTDRDDNVAKTRRKTNQVKTEETPKE